MLAEPGSEGREAPPPPTLTCRVAFFSPPTYEIRTQTINLPGYEATEYLVHRNQVDFEWLRQSLEADHPFCVIPPLAYRPQPDAPLDYSLVLGRFLARVTSHQTLWSSTRLRHFLTAKIWETTGVPSRGALAKKLYSHLAMASSVQAFNQRDLTTAWGHLTWLCPLLQTLHRFALHVDRRTREYHEVLHRQRLHYILWANSETGETSSTLLSMSYALSSIDNTLEEMIDNFFKEQDLPLFELNLFAQEIKETLRRYKVWEDSSGDERSRSSSSLVLRVTGRSSSVSSIGGKPNPPAEVRAEVDRSLTALNSEMRAALASLVAAQAQLVSSCHESWQKAAEDSGLQNDLEESPSTSMSLVQ